MTLSTQVFALSTLFVVLSCSYTERHEVVAAEEIIVKFVADQPINETIVRAFDDKDAEVSLQKSIQGLSEDLGVPFAYSRVTSGREIVLTIPAMAVIEAISARLHESDEVEQLVVQHRATTATSNAVSEILITVDGPDNITSTDATALATQLIGDERFPIDCDIRTNGQLALVPDFEQLIKNLVNALSERPDIDYAQSNYRVRHYERAQ